METKEQFHCDKMCGFRQAPPVNVSGKQDSSKHRGRDVMDCKTMPYEAGFEKLAVARSAITITAINT